MVWLIAAVILAWAIWKLYPLLAYLPVDRAVLVAGRRRDEHGRERSWQTLPEPSDLFEQAGEAFRDGKYAEAIRLALLALIARLEKQGLLRYDTTRTNREYQRELRPTTELAASFRPTGADL